MIFVILTFLVAFAIEALGTLVSVIGLSALFGSNPIIIAFAVALDAGKLIVVSLLYTYWEKLNKIMRSYALVAAAITMIITSAGAAGYLSGEFQKAISGTQEISVKLDSMKREQAKLEERKQQIDRQIENLPEKYTSRQRERAIAGFKEEQKTVTARITEIDKQLPELQTQQISSSAKAGPIISIAKSFNVTPEEAVKWVILVIILVFDPLAVFLIVAGNFLLAQHKKEKLEASLEAKLAAYNPAEHSAPTIQQTPALDPVCDTAALLNPVKFDVLHIDPNVGFQPYQMPPLQTAALKSLPTMRIEPLVVPQPHVVDLVPPQPELKLREIETVEELIDVPPSFSESKQQLEEPVVYEPVPIIHEEPVELPVEDPVELPVIQEQDAEVRIPTESEERAVIKESDILKQRSASSLEDVSAQFGDIVPIEKGMKVSKTIKSLYESDTPPFAKQ